MREKRRGAALLLLASACLAEPASAKPFMDYIEATPAVAPLSSASWGVAGVLPRDLSNGIESAKGAGVHPDYYYWDGQIIRAKDGKYHLFMSTFSGDTNFGTAWQSSDAYHAVSPTNVLGPYQRQDYVFTDNGSHKGHNVSALELPDGTYAVIVSETVPFTIYKSASLDGPWTSCRPTSQVGASNVSLVARHDGKFQIVERNGTIAIADTLCGTYVKQKPTCAYAQNATDSIYPKRSSIPGVQNPTYTWQEDPHIWRSAGVYHVIYSGSGDRVGWHLYSTDGLTWKDNGYAWSPREYQKLFCYEGTTTCTQWYKMERPGVVLQGGHPTHITWAVADVDKDNQVLPGTNHGTKVIVVPFDGDAFDDDFGVGSGGAGGAGAGGTASGGAAGMGAAAGNHETAGAGGVGGAVGGSMSGSNGGGKAGGSATAGASSTTGGAIASGGAVSNGAGGQAAAGSQPVAAGTAGANAAGPSDDSGCSCRMRGGTARATSFAILGAVGSLLRARGHRRRRTA